MKFSFTSAIAVSLLVATPSYAATDVTQIFRPGAANICELPKAGENLLQRMHKIRGRTGTVALPGGARAQVLVRRIRDGEVVETINRAMMPSGVTWNGLKLEYVEESTLYVPESHGPTTRNLAIRGTTAQFGPVLGKRNLATALSTKGLQVETEPYGATVTVKQKGSLAVLTCQTND